MIYSTTLGSEVNLVTRQIIFFGGGIFLLFAFSALDYRYLQRISFILYGLGVALLVSVLFLGLNISGSTRWFDLGFFRLQPVEYMKIALILHLAAFFQKEGMVIRRIKTVALSFLYAAIPIFLTLLQPDLGSAVVLGVIWFGMLLAAGVERKHVIVFLLIFTMLASVGWIYVFEDYQKNRITSFLDPAADPQGSGYNSLQSIIAVGSGGFFGRGFARGVVSQLKFLPERQTDFIFASLAEELGFLGAFFLLSILLFWLFRQTRTIRRARDGYGVYVAVGIFTYFFSQTVINVAMNIGLLPITGIPLPLISYGGSSLIISLVSIGILESIVAHAQPVRFT